VTAAFRILATDKVSELGLEPFRGDGRFQVDLVPDSSSAEFAEVLAEASGLIVRSATNVDEQLLDGASRLKVVGRAGVGVDNIDLKAASERGIAVLNAPGGNTIAAAEMTMALILAVVRKVPEADRSVREGRWDRTVFQGSELRGRVLGLIGAGRIGAEVAKRCMAFGMDVIVFDPYLPPERAGELGVRLVDLETVIANADVVSLHVPLNDETRGILDASALQRMKDGAFVVNASRGGVVDESALADALTTGKLAGAGLDVFESEPLPQDSPLRGAPNTVLTPHLGASTREAQVAVALEVAEGVKRVLLDRDLSMSVNAAQLPGV
jgi:D-3-phosphoglycerate dehydrogenase / 2-oxoglutarate reductase